MTHCCKQTPEVMPMDRDEPLHPLAPVARALRKKRFDLATRLGYLSLLRNVAVMALLFFVAFTQVFLLTVASGTDMFPAILDGDVLLCYRLEREYRKDDVVVATVDDASVIGRVVARGGDNVDITPEGSLYVNGTEQKGEIAFYTYPGEASYPITVPQGCVYLLGDNRSNTVDSRDFGPVAETDVRAKVVSIFRKRGI